LGRLYTYEASTKACPTGWHLPLKAEWNDMEKFIDPKEEGILGDKLAKKSYPGFNVVMAGFKNPKGKYLDKDVSTFFWGSDNVVNLSKEGPGMIYSLYEELSNKDKKNCFPIRCIKD
jgi:uncharacterized protein (TIGR02145 family)